MSEPYIIKNPKVSIEKRPGPNYIKTPVSIVRKWNTAKGNNYYGGMWYKNDNLSVPSMMVHKIYNSRLVNKYYRSIAAKIMKAQEIQSEKDKATAEEITTKGNNWDYYDSHQMIDKIDINSLYGAFGNEYFHLFDINNAINVTLSGQHLINFLADSFNSYFKDEFWKDKKYFDVEDPANACVKDVVVAIETDSVLGDTEISSPDNNDTIEDIWNKRISQWGNDGSHQYGQVEDYNVYSVNDKKEVESKSIKYVMKHSVKKRMFKITDKDGKSVTVTEDHSVIVERSDKFISVKPTEITQNDKIIKIINSK